MPPSKSGEAKVGESFSFASGKKNAQDALKEVNKSDSLEQARKSGDQSLGQQTLERAKESLAKGDKLATQQGQSGVDLSKQLNDLKSQSQQVRNAQRMANRRQVIEYQGVWIDDQLKKDTPTFAIKAMSEAYFKLLERKPEMKEVLQLGQNIVWIAPNGTAIVIDPTAGKETVTDEEIDKLFTKK
jgi:Ca-activated chloride channel homolog